ncbi:hypothetical protein [Nocardioides campestrisoli]|uniref:hypothetical protein n=1 Tax=Nocardioides campestrisoli TaxID=2736757 RepID=UPI0015E6FCBB|nr:hypothetical protein [Nocardioides campestrisoli]
MAERVFLHVGLPKTATTYLQTIVWSNRDRLRADGLVVPGRERRDHLWASRVVREDPHLDRHPAHHRSAWQRLREELATAPGTGLVSHEFFAAASRAQARAAVEALAPAEVHVVVTAREPLGLFTASWQESLKNGGTRPMADYGRAESRSPHAIWDWRTLDLALVLQRWSAAVPPERIHVLPLDPSAPREEIWGRFAGLLGLDPDGYDLSRSFPNSSMGVAEAETLRRVNLSLRDSDHPFERAFDKGVYLRTFLADERLVPRGGEKFWPEPDQIEDCRRRGERAAALVREGGYALHGRLEHLLVPEEVEPRRVPGSVTDAEVAQVAVDLVGRLLDDVRRLSTPERTERDEDGPQVRDGAAKPRALARRLRSGLSRLPGRRG